MAATDVDGESQAKVAPAELLAAVAAEVIDFARDTGRSLRDKKKHKAHTTTQNTPTVGDETFRLSLLEALEDEFVPAVEADHDRIQPTEFEHELIKKALVSLKIKGLQKIAKQANLKTTGTLEELAVSIARQYRWDESELARLVLVNESEPDAERSFISHVYPLAEPADIGDAYERVQSVVGRYVRIGIARWFVFDAVGFVTKDEFELDGTYKAYAARVADEAGVPVVVPISGRDKSVRVAVSASQVVEVNGANSVESAAAKAALQAVTDIKFEGNLPNLRLDGAIDIAYESLLMIDLITTRFKMAGFDARDLTSVRFRVTDADDEADGLARPRLRAVRFEGSHLLDSPNACSLITKEGRALIDVTMSLKPGWQTVEEPTRFPVRISFFRDHVSVMTGFGTVPSGSKGVHRAVMAAVKEMLRDGFADTEALGQLIERMRHRADEVGTRPKADMFGDEYDISGS